MQSGSVYFQTGLRFKRPRSARRRWYYCKDRQSRAPRGLELQLKLLRRWAGLTLLPGIKL